MRRPATIVAILATLALGAAIAPSAQAETCTNEAHRNEQGEPGRALPDCRAYELVSPGQSFLGREEEFLSSLDGNRVAYLTEGSALSEGNGGSRFMASRGQGAWSVKDMVPHQGVDNARICRPGLFYSPDLSKSVIEDGWFWGEGYPLYPDDNGTVVPCGHDEPLLVPGEPEGAQNLFLHDNSDPAEAGFYQLIDQTPAGMPARDAYFQAASTDFSHVVFTDPNLLTPAAPAFPPEIAEYYAANKNEYKVAEDLYEWNAGTLRPLTVLPDGTPAWGLLANGVESGRTENSSAPWTHAVSTDGERVAFYAGGELAGRNGRPQYFGGGLYLRLNAGQAPTASGQCSEAEPSGACTVQLDEPQEGAPGPGGGGKFQWASADGARVFFTDCNRLTAGSTAVPATECGQVQALPNGQHEYAPTGNDLYEYDLQKPPGERLTDLTLDHNGSDPLAADVQGLAGVSEDGSYVYFVAKGVLANNTVENGNGPEAASSGKPNLYLRHEGTTTFIATLESTAEFLERRNAENAEASLGATDACDWANAAFTGGIVVNANCKGLMSARVTPDGRFLAFNSLRSLTGYDNTAVEPNHFGEVDRDHEIFLYDAARKTLRCASCEPNGAPPIHGEEGVLDPRIQPPIEVRTWVGSPAHLNRQLSESGQVFFTTANALLPEDVNKEVKDVYEWEPKGAGGCETEAQNGGCLRLISTGASPERSTFAEASPDGRNVFLLTSQGLVRSDTDNGPSLYDARVGGGFNEPPPLIECETEEACHLEHQQPPPTSSSGSSRFEGPVEDAEHPICPKGQVKKHGACVKVRKHRHKKAKHHKRAARPNRRAAR